MANLIYTAYFPGHYLTGVAVISAPSRATAEKNLIEEAKSHGLKLRPQDIDLKILENRRPRSSSTGTTRRGLR